MRKIEVPQYIKGLIFDCDGTLIDSMPLHMKAWEHVIRMKGGPWDYDFFLSKKGMPEERIVDLYNRRFALQLDPAGTVKLKHEFFRERASDSKPIPHVIEIVYAYRNILPMAVASGGTKANVQLQLKSLGIESFFQAIVSADDKIKPKPAPDIFLEAARLIGVVPEFCQVFEDGDLGLEAARRAGMLPTDIREYQQRSEPRP
jgi:HAD superfamily hydrolase (TIGR01509 family)